MRCDATVEQTSCALGEILWVIQEGCSGSDSNSLHACTNPTASLLTTSSIPSSSTWSYGKRHLALRWSVASDAPEAWDTGSKGLQWLVPFCWRFFPKTSARNKYLFAMEGSRKKWEAWGAQALLAKITCPWLARVCPHYAPVLPAFYTTIRNRHLIGVFLP